jgi:hypothetical protein
MEEYETLKALLAAGAGGTLTVPTVSWILNQIPKDKLTKNQKRMLAVALSFILGIGAFLGLVLFDYVSTPAGPEDWFNRLWPVCVGAFTASQVILSGIKTKKIQRLLK